MPADRQQVLQLGLFGLNLRDHPGDLREGELADSLNWQLARRGALVKRAGFIAFGTVAAPAAILELGTLRLSSGTTWLLAYCANGQVYKTQDGTTWTSIASGLSTTARPQFTQYLDMIFWSNGVDGLRSWDGTTVTSYASAPKGRYLAAWRNRLYVAGADADRRSVYWSAAYDPANPSAFPDYSNTLNRVQFPQGTSVTAIVTAPNVSAGADGSDGVLVFTNRSFHRIIDDTDNAAGAIIGGANVLVDGGHGCVSARSLAQIAGRIFFLGTNGVYSTDGHAPARVESDRIGPVFSNLLSYANPEVAIGIAYANRYYLAFTPVAGTSNSLLLELYLDLQREEDGFPWMAHDIPASAWTLYPGATTDRLLFADASAGDTARVREAFSGGSDLDGASTLKDIRAVGRTGADLYGSPKPKQLRRILAFGDGVILISASADFESSTGETQTFILEDDLDTDPLWGGGQWAGGIWGSVAGHRPKPGYYAKVGTRIALQILETSQRSPTKARALNASVVPEGGAAVEALHVTVIPLDA